MGNLVAGLAKYGIVMPIYVAIRHIIPIMVLYGLPIFIAGMLVALIGTMGHIFFLILFGLAVMYYLRNVYKLFNGKIKTTKKTSKKKPKLRKKQVNDTNKVLQQFMLK